MDRRSALKMLAAASLSSSSIAAPFDPHREVLELDCVELLARIRDGSLRVEQACAQFLHQYELQQSLNTVAWINPQRVLEHARVIDRLRAKGATLPSLAGLPILVKDNIDSVGFPTSAGTSFLKNNFPVRNAPVLQRLVSEGAIVIGKANMHELSFGATSSNPTFGFVRNPYNPDLISGGSSGGSAAGITARIAPAALGTDTVGSIRVPAAFCGVVGFRPSIFPQKLYSQDGIVPNMLDFDTAGPMGRSVADVALLHATIVAGPAISPQKLNRARIGVPRMPYWEGVSAEVARVAEDALKRLRDAGATLVELDLRETRDDAFHITGSLASVGVADLEAYLLHLVPPLKLRDVTAHIASRDVRAGVEARLDARPYPNLPKARHARRAAICDTFRTALKQHSVQAVVFPTEVVTPPRISVNGDAPNEMVEYNGRLVPKLDLLLLNTLPAAALGLPALSIPAGLTTQGLPVALEFDGLPGEDSALLSLGMAAEAALGRVQAPVRVST